MFSKHIGDSMILENKVFLLYIHLNKMYWTKIKNKIELIDVIHLYLASRYESKNENEMEMEDLTIPYYKHTWQSTWSPCGMNTNQVDYQKLTPINIASWRWDLESIW